MDLAGLNVCGVYFFFWEDLYALFGYDVWAGLGVVFCSPHFFDEDYSC